MNVPVASLMFLHMVYCWNSAACSGAGIIGGKEVKPHSSPWMVSLRVNGGHVCGGVLVKEQWVLTAAHCFSKLGSCNAVEAVLGAHSLQKDRDVQRLSVQTCIKPRTFKNTAEDDIMLIKLKNKAKGKHIRVKDLPKSGKDIRSGTICQVTGWGVTNAEAKETKLSDVLRGVQVQIEDRELCSCYYNNNPTITKDMLCAGNKKTKADACYGDSGGPLICKNVLVGVVSGGRGCGDPHKPGVYTRLSDRHLSWVKKIIKHQSNSGSSLPGV